MRRALIASAIVGACALMLGGGLVVSNAWAIGDAMAQPPEPPALAPPVAQRRWYARARFLTPDGVTSPVPNYSENAEAQR